MFNHDCLKSLPKIRQSLLGSTHDGKSQPPENLHLKRQGIGRDGRGRGTLARRRLDRLKGKKSGQARFHFVHFLALNAVRSSSEKADKLKEKCSSVHCGASLHGWTRKGDTGFSPWDSALSL